MADLMEFECRACGTVFSGVWFHLTRSLERVHFDGPTDIPEVETSQAEGLAEFCSQSCLETGERAVMAQQRVPIPAIRPNIGPIEACAKCSGPVDTSDWHLTFTEGSLEELPFGSAVLELDYVAVVCRNCSAKPAQEVETPETFDQQALETT